MSKQDLRGQILLNAGLVTEQQLEVALDLQKSQGGKIGSILLAQGYLQEQDMLLALEQKFGIPWTKLDYADVRKEAIDLVKAELVFKYQFLPIEDKEGILSIALSDPLSYEDLDDLRLVLNREISPLLVSERKLDELVDIFYGSDQQPGEQNLDSHKQALSRIQIEDLLKKLMDEVKLSGATAVDVEQKDFQCTVRLRIDGLLYASQAIKPDQGPLKLAEWVLEHVQADAQEPWNEQGVFEGKLTVEGLQGQLSFYVSMSRTAKGYDLNFKVLSEDLDRYRLNLLGMGKKDLELYASCLNKPSGLLLVTGPKACGLTTMLYASLLNMKLDQKKVISIEQPIECFLPGVEQMAISAKDQDLWPRNIRNVLQLKPDVLMIADIVDRQSAELAVKAALSGHLVIAALKANHLNAAFVQLKDFGVSSSMLAEALLGVTHQRLLRILCPHCRVPDTQERSLVLKTELSEEQLYRGAGCEHCLESGYRRSMGIFELMLMNKELREALQKEKSPEALYALATSQSMTPLKDQALTLVKQKVTSIEELERLDVL